ncbi:hypothetical protein SBA4_2140009 [Candidatus Sulfopaludibacter sp. SbA4]|nr:hypothetical protein SBA4_2140009 [Candidatus Sulfopaludibacter sp. SbA4]
MPARTDSHGSLPESLQELAQDDADEDGADEVVREILASFQADTSSRLLRLHRALERSGRDAIRLQAHAIRGSAVQVGADAVAAVCGALESSSAQQSAADIATLLMRVQACFDEVCRAVGRNGAGSS